MPDRNDRPGSFSLVRLVPFGGGSGLPCPQVEAGCRAVGRWLELEFVVRDPRGEILVPPQAEVPERREGLWRTTCLEAFLAESGEQSYWEVNLSPAGNWNLGYFTGYRQAAMEEARATVPVTQWTAGQGEFVLHCRLDAARLGLAGRPLEIGLCAVVESRAGELWYYALGHPGARPDFHHRGGWRYRLSGDGTQEEAEL